MDSKTEFLLSEMELPEIKLLTLNELEKGDEALLKAKENRSKIEYYFTCTPSLPLFILENFSEVNLITYIDADIYFFSNIKPLFDEIGSHSIAIIAHRFPAQRQHLVAYGFYNVGWLSFRHDENALLCLRWWRQRCNEWCYDRIDGGRFADQKYLDRWPYQFNNLVVLQHKGANLAPWNIENYKISVHDDNICLDGQPLIFFHFHKLAQLAPWLYDTGFCHNVKFTKIMRDRIYVPYLKILLSMNRELSKKFNLTFNINGIRGKQKVAFPGQIRIIFLLLSLAYRCFLQRKCVAVNFRKSE